MVCRLTGAASDGAAARTGLATTGAAALAGGATAAIRERAAGAAAPLAPTWLEAIVAAARALAALACSGLRSGFWACGGALRLRWLGFPADFVWSVEDIRESPLSLI